MRLVLYLRLVSLSQATSDRLPAVYLARQLTGRGRGCVKSVVSVDPGDIESRLVVPTVGADFSRDNSLFEAVVGFGSAMYPGSIIS